MKATRWKIAIALVMIGIVSFGGCRSLGLSDKPNKAEKAAIDLVNTLLSPHYVGEEGDEYTGFLVLMYDYGVLDEGVGVIASKHTKGVEEDVGAAFWVREDTVYWVNDEAKERVPDLAQAPASITYERLMGVVQ